MWHCSFNNRNFYEVLFRIINTLSYSIGYFIGFSQAVSNHTVTVTNNNNGCKTKPATTFHHLCYSFDGNYALLKIDFAGFYCANIAY